MLSFRKHHVTERVILDSLQGFAGDAAVSGIRVEPGGRVLVTLAVDPVRGPALEPMRQRAEAAVAGLPGVRQATVILTAEKEAGSGRATAPDPHGMNRNPPLSLPVRHVIAVASGKGGVGKSTVAFNLAVALRRAGYSVGLLDGDIYGPSLPTLSGTEGRRPEQDDAGRLVPPEAHGLKLMSIGFLSDAGAPMIWRGPMVQTALYQMLRDVAWGTEDELLDILVIDMPPGTGDAQLTLAQKVPVTGAVIVSTPQDLALIDARKAIAMFEKTGVPILGLVENMSVWTCPACGHAEHPFGHGGARAEAEKRNVPFLGEVPLDMAVRVRGDAGEPAARDVFADIASRVAEVLFVS